MLGLSFENDCRQLADAEKLAADLDRVVRGGRTDLYEVMAKALHYAEWDDLVPILKEGVAEHLADCREAVRRQLADKAKPKEPA